MITKRPEFLMKDKHWHDVDMKDNVYLELGDVSETGGDEQRLS